MPRCLELAAEEPERLLNTLNHPVDPFLCQALRGEPAPWSALNPATSPEEFIQRCEHHGVQALLFHQVYERGEWTGWPQSVRHALGKSAKAGVAQDMLRSHHLSRLLQQFGRNGIRCLLTKGEALAITHYDTPGTRARCDSDLFIHLDDIAAAQQAVVDAGLSIVSTVYKTHQFTVSRGSGKANTVQFDVHWRILNHPRYARVISFDEAFDASLEVPGLENARVLNAVDALMLACMHRMGNERHDRNRLIWIYDIHVLFSAMSLSQQRDFSRLAVARGVQSCCRDGLDKASAMFHTVVPQEIPIELSAGETRSGMSRRFGDSTLGLLTDDWRNLASWSARKDLLTELFAPSGDSLLFKYGKNDRRWLPWLYVRQAISGLAHRLSLK